jgi:hypothetical protein
MRTNVLKGGPTPSAVARTDHPRFPVRVDLNHEYFVSNKKTFESVLSSRYLNEVFAKTEVRAPSGRPDDKGWYMYGKNTYAETFPEGSLGGIEMGTSGLATSDEVLGGRQKIIEKMVETFGPSSVDEFVRPLPTNKDELWFHGYGLSEAFFAKNFFSWGQEYAPLKGETNPATRQQNPVRKYDGARLLKDIVSTTFALPAAEIETTRKLYTSLGWTEKKVGEAWVLTTPRDHGVKRSFVLEPASEGRQGIVRIDFELNRPAKYHREQLGDTVLVVGKGPRTVDPKTGHIISGWNRRSATWFVLPPSKPSAQDESTSMNGVSSFQTSKSERRLS